MAGSEPPPQLPPDRDPLGRPARRDPGQWMQASLALTIPTLLLSGPIVGYLLGLGLQKWLGWHEWIVFVMVLMGLAAGIRETIIVIRKLSAATKD